MAKERKDREYAPGERIPGTEYVVIRLEARGGHGVLYLVRHDFLDKIQILKTMRALDPSSELAKRLTREAKTLAGMHHPNIVPVVSGGMTDEPESRPYFVMERLRGYSAASIMDKAPQGVGIGVALQILVEMCDALHYIHERGVIHRDVKPDNIFLERVLPTGFNTKLLDFGVLHLLAPSQRQASEERIFIGTYRYAAPEQLFGEDPTPQTDLYALGLVGYEAITGRHPFASCTTNENLAKAQIATEAPPFPPAHYPEGLEALLLHMLRKVPSERPKSAQWLAFQFRQIRLQVELQERTSASNDIDSTHPSPVQNALTMTRAEATDPGEAATDPGAPPEESEDRPQELRAASDSSDVPWPNQAASVERSAAPIDRTTEDTSAAPPLPLTRAPEGARGDAPARERSAGDGPSNDVDDRYQESVLPDPEPPQPVAPRPSTRALSPASNGVVVAGRSAPQPRQRAATVSTDIRWALALGVAVAAVLTCANAYFHSPVSYSSAAVPGAPSLAMIAPPPTSSSAPATPVDISRSSAPIVLRSSASPAPLPRPLPARSTARPAPAPAKNDVMREPF